MVTALNPILFCETDLGLVGGYNVEASFPNLQILFNVCQQCANGLLGLQLGYKVWWTSLKYETGVINPEPI